MTSYSLILAGEENDHLELLKSGRIRATSFEIPEEEKHRLMLEGKLYASALVDGQEMTWNPALDRDPRTSGNKNAGEKGGFRFSPFFHKKGIDFQSIIKVGIIKAIDTAHSAILGDYDPEAYYYEDPRLQELSGYFRTFIAENFQDGADAGNPRKLVFTGKIFDVVLFLMKEDIYYRARFLKMFAGIPLNCCFLSKNEEENLEKWR